MEETLQQNNNVQQNTNNNIQPITVPLQIQPVVQQPTTPVVQDNTLNNVPNVQTTVDNNPQQQAPAPVQYQRPVQLVQPVQTVQPVKYQGYKINKIDLSNIDTTSATGQFKSAYGSTINQILTELYNNRYFDYNPNEDLALQQAIDYSEKTTTSSLASRGILNSTITAERIAKVVSDLTAEYRKLALSEWQTQMNMIANVGQMFMNMDEYEFKKWQDARDQQWKEKMHEYEVKQNEIKNAWTRVDELGYVDNKASTVLGIAVGTLSKSAREAKEAYQRELEMMQRKAEVQYQTEVKLAQVKNDLQKDLIKYEYNYSTKSNSSSSNVNLSTYEKIINNNWASYDDFSKKYTVSATNNDKIYNYLMSEYNAGRLSQNDAASLIALYGIKNPNDPVRQARLQYLQQLSGK